jgi:hypothetical protein
VLLAVAYLGVGAAGTAVAVRENLPARFLGIRTGLPAGQDFVFGMGTALSGPLAFVAAIAVAATVAATSPNRDKRRRANGALAALGACGTFGMLGEPITYRVLRRPGRNKAKAAMVLANVVLPASMSGRAWRLATS